MANKEPSPAAADLGPRIPVKVLIFRESTSMPGSHNSTIECGGRPGSKRHECDYLTRLGLFELRFYPVPPTKPAGMESAISLRNECETRLVPREWASFIPVPAL